MITRQIFVSTLLGAALYSTSLVHAATVNFSPTTVTSNVNDFITLDILMDFTGDPTVGGGTDIFYDASILSYQSFNFGTTTLSLDPAFIRTPDIKTNKLEGLAFGNFGGLSGPGIVGTLTFQAITPGNTTLSMATTSNLLGGGGFFSATTFGPQTVSFGTAKVEVSNVPLPAAVWLFGSGLLGLVSIVRKHRIV